MLFMKKIRTQIIINCESLETRAAILEEGRLEDFFVERPADRRIVGNIYKGRIQNLEDGLQAAFVDIGMRKNAFIHYWDMIVEDVTRLEVEEGVSLPSSPRKKRYPAGEMATRFPVGAELIVQVTKDTIGTKGPRVTANLSLPGRYLVMMPGSRLKGVSRKIEDAKERERLKKVLARLPIPEGNGVILRTAGAGARKTSFARDLRGLLATWQEIEQAIAEKPAPCLLYKEPDLIERVVRDSMTQHIDRVVIDSREEYERLKTIVSGISRSARGKLKIYDGDAPIFEHFDVEQQIANAFRRKVALPSGGHIVIDETEALVAIDVNTARHKGGGNQEDLILEVNLEAAQEVARQLRLRNVGGLVVVDFIDLRHKRHQHAVYRALKQALQRDKARTNVLPISPLGIMEMTRQRVEESIGAASYANCPYCRGRGKVKSALSMSVAIQREIAAVLRKARVKRTPLRVKVNPSVLARLRNEDESILVELQERYGAHLVFVEDANCHIEECTLIHAETGQVLSSIGESQ